MNASAEEFISRSTCTALRVIASMGGKKRVLTSGLMRLLRMLLKSSGQHYRTAIAANIRLS